jgi:cobalt-zinc-cadmium efflux system membrane fusion protein
MTRNIARVALLLLLGATAACSRAAVAQTDAGEHDRESIQLAAGSAHLNFLKIVTVEESDDTPAVVLTGKVAFDEYHTQRVASPVDGRAIRILVESGDKVKTGQVLFELTSPTVGQMQGDMQKALSDLALSEKALARMNSLKADGAVSAKEVAQAESEYRKAKADVGSSSSRIRALNLASDPGAGAAIRTAIDGTVVDRSVLVGQEVRADGAVPLMTVSNLETVWVLGDVYEQDLALVQKGSAVVVTVAAYPSVTFAGRVGQISNVVDPVTHTVKLRCVVPNPEEKLKPEMFAKIQLSDVGGKKIVIPSRALLNDTQPPRVILALENNTFQFRKVEAGPEVAGKVRILSGLKPGEKIVSGGAIFLKQEIVTQ